MGICDLRHMPNNFSTQWCIDSNYPILDHRVWARFVQFSPQYVWSFSEILGISRRHSIPIYQMLIRAVHTVMLKEQNLCLFKRRYVLCHYCCLWDFNALEYCKMPPPFSDWFCSLPFKLDALAQAAKVTLDIYYTLALHIYLFVYAQFQHERLTNAARYYKSRYLQYRAMSIQKHNEIKALKKSKTRVYDACTMTY